MVYSPTKTWIEKEIVYKMHCRFKQKNCIECYEKVHSFLVFHSGLGITRKKIRQATCLHSNAMDSFSPNSIPFESLGVLGLNVSVPLFRTCCVLGTINPVDTGQKLKVDKTFRRRPGRLLNDLCTFNVRPVLTEEFIR